MQNPTDCHPNFWQMNPHRNPESSHCNTLPETSTHRHHLSERVRLHGWEVCRRFHATAVMTAKREPSPSWERADRSRTSTFLRDWSSRTRSSGPECWKKRRRCDQRMSSSDCTAYLHFEVAREDKLRHGLQFVGLLVLVVRRVRLEDPWLFVGAVRSGHFNEAVERMFHLRPANNRY